MRRLLLGAMLVGALSIAPNTLRAQDHDHDHDQNHENTGRKTYYDSSHKDRHEWNDNENSAWTRYRGEHHVKQSDFANTNKRQQQNYWNWRHQHPDEH
jgi:hypothetical protein